MLTYLRFHRFKRRPLILLLLITCLSLKFYPYAVPSSNIVLKTTTSSHPRRCRPYRVPDNRTFFEREPIQPNLPRRLTGLLQEDLLRRLRSLRLVVVSCSNNDEGKLDRFRTHIEPVIDLFHPTSQILILESDSSDKTLLKLQNWSRPKVYSYGRLRNKLPGHTELIAYCRNELLKKAYALSPDYILVTDLDRFAPELSAFLSNFRYNTDDWSAMTATGVYGYFDLWPLRTLSDSVLNFDVWVRIGEIAASNPEYCRDSISKQIIDVHQHTVIPVERGLIEVRSAFGGTGLYKANATRGCTYDGKGFKCEHVSFNLCIREKNKGRIFINPEFVISE